MGDRRKLVRSQQWWGHKIPPVLGVSAIAIGLSGASGRDLRDLLLVLVSMIGVAAFGHLMNDVCDIDADARGGKANLMAGLSVFGRARLLAGSLALGVLPWSLLPAHPAARVAILVELALLVAYSAPPLRLKARGWLGALADASYAYAVPFLLVVALFGPEDLRSSRLAAAALLGLWGLLVGLRSILWHQISDLESDRTAGMMTAAARLGHDRTEAVVASLILPLEVVTGAALTVLSGIAWLQWMLLAFLAWRAFQLTMLWVPPIQFSSLRRRNDRVEVIGFAVVNEFMERWLPMAALIALAVASPWWWAAVVVHLVVFPNAVRSFIADDIWFVPDGIERLMLSRGMRSDIRQVARRRMSRVRSGPPAHDVALGRFVFVVCGPLPHLRSLSTAIRHLRPVTNAEIWVLTDSHRNAQAIDIEGVDQVIDVLTPEALDDHQASIWLKTSAHRHLPEGEWCYLDSDIIATVPGVDGVFAERHGPVAFASDVPIRENSVDRFSPWAMTCDCAGYGDQHSCRHLRDQLLERFGLAVPGDWLHWNGGVFLFGSDSGEFLDLWHERAVASFAWPEWKTRDQGALIATAWTLGMQDLPRVSLEFNFIADLGNHNLCLDPKRGWAHHSSGPWCDPKFLHLYTSALDDPAWSLGIDVEAVILRRNNVRMYRWERMKDFFDPRRLTPYRVKRGVRVRLGLDVSHLPYPLIPSPSAAGSDDTD